MAPKRNRAASEPVEPTPVVPTNVPSAPDTAKNTNTQFDSMLEAFEKMQAKMDALENDNKSLKKQIAAAGGDISEEIKEAKREYGFDSSKRRIPEEMFKFGYRVLMHENADRVVVSSKTIGRPINQKNTNNGKWTNIHNVEIEFHDGTKAEMDILDYINQYVKIEDFVADEDIKTKDGKKFYTFRTEQFGTFTVAENFIN